MGDRLQAGKPSRYVTSDLGQLSLPSIRGRSVEYRPVWLGLRQGVFTCVGWQVTLCDPMWQVTLLCHRVHSINSYTVPLPFLPLMSNSGILQNSNRDSLNWRCHQQLTYFILICTATAL